MSWKSSAEDHDVDPETIGQHRKNTAVKPDVVSRQDKRSTSSVTIDSTGCGICASNFATRMAQNSRSRRNLAFR